MDEALRLGETARGRSAPNPNVGCVIVSAGGRIVGKGATAPGGRPHAEAIALDQAGRRARGATVYVTRMTSRQQLASDFSFTVVIRRLHSLTPDRACRSHNECNGDVCCPTL